MSVAKAKGVAVLAALQRRAVDLLRAAAVLLRRLAARAALHNGTARHRSTIMKLSFPFAAFQAEHKGASAPSRGKTHTRWTLTIRATGANTFTCSVGRPFRETVQLLRAALKRGGMSVPVEIDASARVRRTFGGEPRPCRVICVDCPLTLLPAAVVDVPAIGLFPLHVVVASESAVESSIYLATPPGTGLNDRLTLPYGRFLGHVLGIIGRVAGA